MKQLALIALLLPMAIQAATVNINAGFPFSPSSVTITAGDTIHIDFFCGFHNAAETSDPLPGPATYNGGFRSGNIGAVCTYDFIPSAGPHKFFCEFHGGSAMYGYIFVVTPTPTPTSTITPTATETQTFTFSPTITETFTDSPTPTITDTFTDGPSPTITSTPSATGTTTATPTISATHSPTLTQSPSFTASPIYAQAPGADTIIGPVPVKAGLPICLAFPKAPYRSSCQLFNSRGESVAKGKFNGELRQCLETQNLSPGLYFAEIEEDDLNQKHSVRRQKIVILP